MPGRTCFIALASVLFAATLSASGIAQNFPAKPVRVLAPYSPGSGPDTMGRLICDRLSKMWNQQVLVENRPGANGIIAIEGVKKSPADGYNLIIVDNMALTVNPLLYANIPYDSENDLSPLALLLNTPFYLMVNSASPIKSVKDMIAYAKENPGKLSYGSPTGVGAPGHLGMEQFKVHTGTDMVLVPYKTAPPMFIDLASGTLQVAWASYGTGRAVIQSGAVRLLAVGAKTRQPGRPEVPTIGEVGGPEGLEVSAWLALYGPRGLPGNVTAKIAADVDRVLRMPDVVERIIGFDNEPLYGGPAQVTERMRADSRRYGELIKRLGLKIE